MSVAIGKVATLLRKMRGARLYLLIAVVLGHVVAVYVLTHARTRVGIDGPPMFGPAIAKHWVPQSEQAIRSRHWQPAAEAEASTPAERVWHFPRADIWPMSGEPCPTPSEFGPFMDTQPAAEEVQPKPKRTAGSPDSKTATPRMVVWLRPAYPLEWAMTEMEGTVRLAFEIRSTGNTQQIEVERSSGSGKLDAAAAQAATAWRFAPVKWQGRPIESKATVELTFNFFEYHVSAIDEVASTRASARNVARMGRLDRSARVRTFVEALRSDTMNERVAPAYGNQQPSWPATMRDWGPVSDVQYLGPIGAPEWRRYEVKLKNRTAKQAKNVVIRWELYKVMHTDNEALWEFGIDRNGGVWAVAAEPLKTPQGADSPAAPCVAVAGT